MSKNFTPKTIEYLREIAINNSKDWFEQNRENYEQDLRAPLLNLAENLGDFMLTIDSGFEISPKKIVSRIWRDTRFSRDKSPLKTNFWTTFKKPRKNWVDAPAFFFEISADFYRFGMGFYRAAPKTMAAFRNLIDEFPHEFSAATTFFEQQKIFKLAGEKYKRVFDSNKSEKLQNWFQRKNFYLVAQNPIDKKFFAKNLTNEIISSFEILRDFYKFLTKLKKNPAN